MFSPNISRQVRLIMAQILYKNKWATLECKKSLTASHRPNQEYYVNMMNAMSFSRFICPENKKEVLHELQQSFKA